MDGRPLHNEEILGHLLDFGLAKDYGLGACKQLSGGQRSRVVLAAAMWMKPHLLILDEPTNYLDVEALDALQNALLKFQGATVIVSHHETFLKTCCDNIWMVRDGKVLVDGKETKAEDIANDEVVVTKKKVIEKRDKKKPVVRKKK
jgi:ATPase subunit of ABC transporter with duplicated ATPase domains